jgi:hypothetical protein
MLLRRSICIISPSFVTGIMALIIRSWAWCIHFKARSETTAAAHKLMFWDQNSSLKRIIKKGSRERNTIKILRNTRSNTWVWKLGFKDSYRANYLKRQNFSFVFRKCMVRIPSGARTIFPESFGGFP